MGFQRSDRPSSPSSLPHRHPAPPPAGRPRARGLPHAGGAGKGDVHLPPGLGFAAAPAAAVPESARIALFAELPKGQLVATAPRRSGGADAMDVDSTGAGAPADAAWLRHGARSFRALAKRPDGVAMEATVEVTAEYPLRPPRFTVLSITRTGGAAPRAASPAPGAPLPGSENVARAIELEVNVYVHELVPPGAEAYLLSFQMKRLLGCLDIYAESEQAPPGRQAGVGSAAGGTGVLGGPAGSAAALAGRWFVREARGRDRRRPFAFDEGTRLFDQRR
eukprot:tig00021012_g17018.t1